MQKRQWNILKSGLSERYTLCKAVILLLFGFVKKIVYIYTYFTMSFKHLNIYYERIKIMGVSIIRGAISSGKSDMCLKQISEIHEKNPDSKCIMIVPDHYSYETERKFVDFFGGIGLKILKFLR